ncbi:hypothetical protein RhiirA1_456387 [Rhizophagus irregularis]|uniref:Uncharacterized protein n=1 Tax=Rhizophagus irregularis TaxID=588596 RepID=A0A2I1EMG9_9GLOM|nr:hypothetical protein RhiirA1_456387 [Rhizophagus irregularis]PKY23336.1 hypothetical protein RhiirB3_437521 [Rhizophagus irregularis]
MNLEDNNDNYGYDYDSVEEMRRQIEEDDAIEGIRHQLEEFHINQAKIINTVKKLAKAQYRCFNCDKSSHNSRNCPKKKKKCRRTSKRCKVNLVVDDSDTNSDGSSSSSGESETESSSASEGEISANITKSFMSVDTIRKIIQSELGVALQEEIKKILSSLPTYMIQARPVRTFPLDTKKQDWQNWRGRRDSSQNKSISSTNPVPVSMNLESDPSESEEDDYLDNSMEIDFVQKKEPKTSIASVKCKIKHLKILAMALDSAAKIPIITENIVKRVKADINKSIKHDLSGIATAPTESIRVIHNLPVILAPSHTIYEDFVVVKYLKPMLIFSNPLLKKYRYAIDWNKNELKIPHNGHGRHTKKNMKYEELKEKLYAALKSKAELNDLCERLQAHHSKQLG